MELKPCPICGDEAEICHEHYGYDDIYYYAECNAGCVRTCEDRNTNTIVNLWNTRHKECKCHE